LEGFKISLTYVEEAGGCDLLVFASRRLRNEFAVEINISSDGMPRQVHEPLKDNRADQRKLPLKKGI